MLTAKAPGYAPARVAPLQMRPDLEAQVLDPLVLARPVSVEIRIDPPREPYGAAWKVQLIRKASLSDPPLETLRCQSSREEGVCRIANVVPGSYELLVLGERDDRWHDGMIDIGPAPSPIEVRIPLVEVRGTVVRGEDAVAATVWLVRDGRSLRFDTDAGRELQQRSPGSPQRAGPAESVSWLQNKVVCREVGLFTAT